MHRTGNRADLGLHDLAAGDPQHLAEDECLGDAASGLRHEPPEGGARDAHTGGGSLMVKADEIG